MVNVRTLLVALVVAVVAFLVALVASTTLFDPYVWPSLIVTIPFSLVVGVYALASTTLWLTWRDQRTDDEPAAARTYGRLLALTAGAVSFVVIAALAVAVAGAVLAVPVVTAILTVGVPVGLVVALVVAILTLRYRQRPATA